MRDEWKNLSEEQKEPYKKNWWDSISYKKETEEYDKMKKEQKER